jgi:hypothetical protein
MAARDHSQVAPPRKVTLSGEGSAVWVLEVRTLGLLANTSQQLHANMDVRARGMRSVAEWALTTYSLPERNEAVMQLVIRRRTAALRPDNVFLAWSRVLIRLFRRDATLARRQWQEFPTKAGGTYCLYCDARAAAGLFPAVCRSLAESMGGAGAKVLAHSTDALPPLPRGLRQPAGA